MKKDKKDLIKKSQQNPTEYKPQPRKKTNIEAVVAMHAHSMSTKEIAAETETSTSNIRQMLKRYRFKLEKLENFKTHESLLQTGVKEKIVKAIAHGSIPINTATDLKNAAFAYDKFFNASRLQEDRSTANIALKIDDIDPETLAKLRQFVADMYK